MWNRIARGQNINVAMILTIVLFQENLLHREEGKLSKPDQTLKYMTVLSNFHATP